MERSRVWLHVNLGLFFFWLCYVACRILVPRPGIEPRPQQWAHWVLTTRPPGNSQTWALSLLCPDWMCCDSLWGGFHWHTFTLQVSNPGWPPRGFACAESALFVSETYSPSPFKNNFYFPEPTEGFGYVKPLWDTCVENSQPTLILIFPCILLLWKILHYFFFLLSTC